MLVAVAVVIATLQIWIVFWLMLLIDLSICIFIDVADSTSPF